MDAYAAATSRARGLTFLFIMLFALAAGFSAWRKDITQGFDELAHVSYVSSLQESRALWPRLETLQMLDPKTLKPAQEANYLNHPSPYYLLLAWLGPRIEGRPDAIFTHRLINIAIVVFGLAFAMSAVFRLRFETLEIYAVLLSLIAIPFLAPLAGAVNNDNLAFAGGALAMLAAVMFLQERQEKWLYAALIGVVIASVAKLTGLLLAGGFIACVLGYLILRGEFRARWIAPVLFAALLAAAPYIAFILQYGSPAPDTQAQAELLRSGSQTTGWSGSERLSLVSYAAHFIGEFFSQWIPALERRSLFNYAMLTLPAVTVLLALAGFCVSINRFRERNERTLDIVVIAGWLAILLTFGFHFAFSYQRHLATGWMLDAYPRYYLPLVAIIPIAALVFAKALSSQMRNFLIGFLILAPILFRLFAAPITS
jgi:hypothetical protein